MTVALSADEKFIDLTKKFHTVQGVITTIERLNVTYLEH